MADKSSRNAIPQTSPQLTLEERFAALEANFIDFKKVHIDLHERIFKLTEDANGKITEVAVTEVSGSTIFPIIRILDILFMIKIG